MGEEKLVALIQESLNVATRTGAAKPADFAKVIVDTTVQPKAVAFPTDAKLMHRARERLVRLAKKHGVVLRQSYERVGKYLSRTLGMVGILVPPGNDGDDRESETILVITPVMSRERSVLKRLR
jgi:hypothetical protein